MSKYQELYRSLKQRIEEGTYPPGTYLPSETELMEEFGVGRYTARQSLDLLTNDGLIQKEMGKGSRVIAEKSREDLYDLVAYPYIPGEDGMETLVTDVRLIMPTGEISRNLGQKARSKVWKVTRLRMVRDEPAVLEKDYVDSALVPHLDVELAEKGSWDLAKEKTGMDISYSRKEITLKPASSKEAQTLRMQEGDTVAVVRSWTFLQNSRQLQYTVAKHNPKHFQYADFLRSKKGK